jgi:hypothetical protein
VGLVIATADNFPVVRDGLMQLEHLHPNLIEVLLQSVLITLAEFVATSRTTRWKRVNASKRKQIGLSVMHFRNVVGMPHLELLVEPIRTN